MICRSSSSGLFNQTTTGAPISILFENNNTRSADYEKQRAVPRPGHADFVAHKKFGGFEDYRGRRRFFCPVDRRVGGGGGDRQEINGCGYFY
jgi:chorismate synthase